MKTIYILFLFISISNLYAQDSMKSWNFYDSDRQVLRTLKQGQKVTVFWMHKKNTGFAYGRLVDIDDEYMLVKEGKKITKIPKMEIRDIGYKANHRRGLKEAGSFLCVVGLLVIGLGILIMQIYLSTGLNPHPTFSELFPGPWLTIAGIGAVIWGTILLSKANKTLHIKKPFQQNWEITYLPDAALITKSANDSSTQLYALG